MLLTSQIAIVEGCFFPVMSVFALGILHLSDSINYINKSIGVDSVIFGLFSQVNIMSNVSHISN